MTNIDLNTITVFENYQLEKMEEGQVVLTTEVVASSLNYYGKAHGGYLFTLCDQVSGLVLRSYGLEGVTLQSSINYLKAGQLGDYLTIRGKALHTGRTTQVVEVTLSNQENKLLCRASFTMFVTGKKIS